MERRKIYVLSKTWDLYDEGYGSAIIGAFLSRKKVEAAMEHSIKEVADAAACRPDFENDYDIEISEDLWEYHYANGNDVVTLQIMVFDADVEYEIEYNE